MGMLRATLITCCLLFLSACSTHTTGFASTEDQITARGGIGENGLFHDIIYNPESISLSFPGYVVGLDKGRHRDIADGETLPQIAPGDMGAVRDFKFGLEVNPKLYYVSHIVKDSGKPYGEQNCILYSIYQTWGDQTHSGDSPNDDFRCGKDGPIFGEPRKAFSSSWTAIEILREELKAAVSTNQYTHVVLIVMGWNTTQIEAVRNFNAILSNVRRASGENFRPLVVGVTWASYWSAEWFEPLVEILSYPDKSSDADRIGFSWLGEITRVVSETADNLPRIAIGHSFGARALATALCAGSQIEAAGPNTHMHSQIQDRPWDLFIGWEAAFSIKRFSPEGDGDGFLYANGCAGVRDIVLTSSEHDVAVTKSGWAKTIGSAKVWKFVCKEGGAQELNLNVQCVDGKDLKDGTYKFRFLDNQLTYVDVSPIVVFNQPNTGGGAHSDIFRPIHGRFVWSAISAITQ